MQQGEFTLEVVESLGVFSEYHGFVLIVDIFPFENFIDLMQCLPSRFRAENRTQTRTPANRFDR